VEKKSILKNRFTSLLSQNPKFHGREKAGTEHYPLSGEVLTWIFDHLQPGAVTLETGCGYSTVVFALLSRCHRVISPFYQEHEVIEKWCSSHDISTKNVKFTASISQDAIHSLPGDFRPDMVLIDGDHAFPAPFIDFYYTADRLKKGGYVIVDDTQLITGGILKDFLLTEKGRWEKHVEIGKTVIFRKSVSTPVVRGIPWINQPFVNTKLSDK
jgi:predicted O-methyltransferase YrrM